MGSRRWPRPTDWGRSSRVSGAPRAPAALPPGPRPKAPPVLRRWRCVPRRRSRGSRRGDDEFRMVPRPALLPPRPLRGPPRSPRSPALPGRARVGEPERWARWARRSRWRWPGPQQPPQPRRRRAGVGGFSTRARFSRSHRARTRATCSSVSGLRWVRTDTSIARRSPMTSSLEMPNSPAMSCTRKLTHTVLLKSSPPRPRPPTRGSLPRAGDPRSRPPPSSPVRPLPRARWRSDAATHRTRRAVKQRHHLVQTVPRCIRRHDSEG